MITTTNLSAGPGEAHRYHISLTAMRGLLRINDAVYYRDVGSRRSGR
jgi:hypothetical protein